MSVCPIIMATVSIPTRASIARVAHVWRHDVIDTHGAPERLQAALMRRAMASGERVQRRPFAPFLMLLRRFTANLGSQHDRALRSVFGATSTTLSLIHI